MSAKKRASHRSSAAAAAEKQPSKPVAAIELSSDSDSDPGSDEEGSEPPGVATSPARQAAAGEGPVSKRSNEAAPSPSAPESPASQRQRKLVVRVKDGEGPPTAKAAAAAENPAPAPGKKGVHVRFGDGDDDKFFTPLEVPATNPLEKALPAAPVAADDRADSEDEDDDDAPPEAVSTSAAALRTREIEQIAAKAAESQAAAQRAKRRRRDALFKTQALKRALDADDKAVEAEGSGGGARGKAPPPALLPAEFLESDDEEDEADGAGKAAEERRPKKIKFETAERKLAREGRAPADMRVGSTVYRVLGERDQRLAPERSRHTAGLKQKLLTRGRPEVAVGARRGGFLIRR